MEAMTLQEIACAVNGKLMNANSAAVIDTISTNSKEAGSSTLFIALKGERFDGHDFLPEFYRLWGAAAISQQESDWPVVLVEDTRVALGALAGYYRTKFNIPLIGITGSAGKTTTRRMVESVLSTAGPVCGTQGNLNNDIGMPKTLLTLDSSHHFAVIEMGMNHAGEIRYMTKLARPDIAVITNIGTAHIGNLGSRQAILRAKMEIFEGLPPYGLALLNGDDKRLWALRGKLPFRTMYYGIHNPACDIIALDVNCGALESTFNVGGADYHVAVAGEHHVYNALVAIAIGLEYHLPVEDLQRGVGNFRAGDMRQNVIETGGLRLIEDCYNASAESMLASLSVLGKSDFDGRKIAVLGNMGELGDFAESVHRQVGDHAVKCGVDVLFTVGDHARWIAENAQEGGVEAHSFDNKEKALQVLLGLVQAGDTVLVKASRGAKFEEISQGIQARLGAV